MAMKITAMLLQPGQPFRRAHDIRYADTEIFIDNHDLALCYKLAVDQEVHRLARQFVELDNRSFAESQYVLYKLRRPSQLHGQGHGHVKDEGYIPPDAWRNTFIKRRGEYIPHPHLAGMRRELLR